MRPIHCFEIHDSTPPAADTRLEHLSQKPSPRHRRGRPLHRTHDRVRASLCLRGPGHGRRRILHVEVTSGPTAVWLAQQLTEAFPWNSAPTFLVRDNDCLFSAKFRQRINALGLRDRPVRPHSPWMNGHVERLIGSIRRECTDHQLIWSQAHLRKVLQAYAHYYNNDRPHLALDKDSPDSRSVETHGQVSARSVLGGLHRRYYRTTPK